MSVNARPKKGAGPKNGAFIARMQAVQAIYESMHNERPVTLVVEDYLYGKTPLIDGETIDIKPDGLLLKGLIEGVRGRGPDLAGILDAHYRKDGKERVKEPESLLKAIMLCGVFELMCTPAMPAPVIINDYVDITHSFYDKSAASLVNAILDSCSKALRS